MRPLKNTTTIIKKRLNTKRGTPRPTNWKNMTICERQNWLKSIK